MRCWYLGPPGGGRPWAGTGSAWRLAVPNTSNVATGGNCRSLCDARWQGGESTLPVLVLASETRVAN
jgi:hypothetical protein